MLPRLRDWSKATEHQQAGTPPFEQVQGDVQNAMYQDAIQSALRAYLTKLREEAYIDLRPGFVDSGASSRETKPVFAAYVPPAPKKKQVQKQRLDAAAANARLAQTRGGSTAATPAVLALDKHGKPKKVKREKVRFGQAPRTALPEASGPAEESAAGLSINTTAPTSTAAAVTTGAEAPGSAISPVTPNSNTVAAHAS